MYHRIAACILILLATASNLAQEQATTTIAPLAIMPAHRPETLGVVFSIDGKWLVSTGADRLVTIRDPATGTLRRVLRGHTSRVYRAVVSPDSALLATCSADGTVRVWSIVRGDQVAMFNAGRDQPAAARAVAFSPDGQTLASGADDGTIKLWKLSDKKEIRELQAQQLLVSSLAFTPDGAVLVSSTGDWRNNRLPGELRLWEVGSGKELARLEGHAGEIKCIAIDPSGKRLASSGAEKMVRLWSMAERTPLDSFPIQGAGAAVAFSPDGSRIAVGDTAAELTVWDIATRKPAKYAGHAKTISGVSFSPDGKRLATASHDGTLGLWTLERGQ